VGKVTVGVRARYIDLIQKNDWNQAMALLVQTCTFDDDLGSRSFEDGDADLAGIGFRDDDMEFLRVAGAAADQGGLDEVTRLLISREMGRITARTSL
jgi:hypothetical protein